MGVPASPGFLGWLVLAVGAAVAVPALAVLHRKAPLDRTPVSTARIVLLLTVAVLPYVGWRFVEDLRVTTRLHGYDAAAAGPVQAFLPGYLVDGAQLLMPREATFATAVSPSVPWQSARAAFPSLARETLFPRRSVADPQRADYVITWGIAPARVARVSRVWVVRRRAGTYPAVYVGKVAP